MSIDNIHFKQFDTKLGMFGLLLTMVLVQGCASSSPKRSKADNAAMPDFAMPSPGKSKVIFIRPNSNGGIDVGVHDGEQLAAKLSGKTYGVYECDPGQHLFSGSFGNVAILEATLLPDRIYYVKAVLVVQTWGPAWVKLSPIHPGGAGSDWQQMARTLADVKMSVVTPEQAEHDRKGIGRYMERMKVYRNKPGAVSETILPEYGQATPARPQ
jgi:hypothetical protein